MLVTDAFDIASTTAARALTRSGFDVVAGASPAPPRWLRPRYWHEVRVLSGTGPRLDERLIALVRDARCDVLLPISTAMAEAAARARPALEGETAVLAPGYNAFMAAYDRVQMAEACARAGVPVAATLSLDEAERALDGGGGSDHATVVVKPRLEAGGARGVSYCRDRAGLRAALSACAAEYGEPMVQAFVPGPPRAMRSVSLLFDEQSRLLAYFCARKVRQSPPSGGLTALAYSADDRDLVETVLPFFKHVGWQGLAEVEVKLDTDGVPTVIEVNPRASVLIGFAAQCGVDFASLAVRAALGAPPEPPPRYREGVRYLSPTSYWTMLLAESRTGAGKRMLAGRAWSDLRGARLAPSLDPRDPTLYWKLWQRARGLRGAGRRTGP